MIRFHFWSANNCFSMKKHQTERDPLPINSNTPGVHYLSPVRGICIIAGNLN
jgi:hypothetical protein